VTLSEEIEGKRKRSDFLLSERQQKQAELEQLEEKIRKIEEGTLWKFTRHAGAISLKLHEMKSRAEDIKSQIRSLSFEIGNLEADIRKGLEHSEESKRMKRFCISCGKDISQLPTDAKFCPFCGSKLF
jgi:rRNA maturation endonuclease Nob1